MEATVDSGEKLRASLDDLRAIIDEALDNRVDEEILTVYARLLRERKTMLVQLEKAELNRHVFRLR
jgi:ABC-type histidine transport system ATPase subunit